MHISNFDSEFKWGVSTAAYQIEGAHQADGKGPSIWDEFTQKKGKIYQGQNANIACDFYHRYEEDIELMKSMNIPNYRFSIAWSRILPDGTGKINPAGVDFYHRVIDKCLDLGIEPWITLYHWDLPAALHEKGGWTNRDVVGWFTDYVELCIKLYADRVKNWIVVNEPMVMTGAGYFFGWHAPGKKGLKNFLPAAHHITLCQAEGARVIKAIDAQLNVGTTFSCSYIEPFRNKKRDQKAAFRADALINRMFFEPLLGMGYPLEDLKFMQRIEKYMQPNDEQLMAFDFDFIGIQNYTRELVKHSFFTPYIYANLAWANTRNVPHTEMNWEVYPEAMYEMLKKYGSYPNCPPLIVTENGAAFTDRVDNGQVHDPKRTSYIQENIAQVLRAQKEGIDVRGYFIWTFTDNFEWAEGFRPRFGLVHVDFETQQRTIKDSGKWYSQFLTGESLEHAHLQVLEEN
ncbi:MAG: GH1 family beta-glucosidase [Flammeovirgaceae bacterium]